MDGIYPPGVHCSLPPSPPASPPQIIAPVAPPRIVAPVAPLESIVPNPPPQSVIPAPPPESVAFPPAESVAPPPSESVATGDDPDPESKGFHSHVDPISDTKELSACTLDGVYLANGINFDYAEVIQRNPFPDGIDDEEYSGW